MNLDIDVAALFRAFPDFGDLSSYGVSRGRLDISSQKLTQGEEAAARLQAFGGVGWICFADEVVRVSSGQWPQGERDLPLSAELVKGDTSLHLRPAPRGEWILAEITRVDGGDGRSWIVEHVYLGRAAARGDRLRYEVGWTRNENGVFTPENFRFAGFIESINQPNHGESL